MKRRDFLAAAAAIVVPVNFESWNKFIESEDFHEYIYLKETKDWYLIHRVNLTDKKEDRVSNAHFYKALPTRVKVGFPNRNCDIFFDYNIPLVNKRFSVEDKQALLKDLIRVNRNSGKMFVAEIRIGNLTNLYGWVEECVHK